MNANEELNVGYVARKRRQKGLAQSLGVHACSPEQQHACMHAGGRGQGPHHQQLRAVYVTRRRAHGRSAARGLRHDGEGQVPAAQQRGHRLVPRRLAQQVARPACSGGGSECLEWRQREGAPAWAA